MKQISHDYLILKKKKRKKGYIPKKLTTKNFLKYMDYAKMYPKKRKRKRIIYFLFLKFTLNNLFAYVYNFYNYKRIKKKVKRSKLNFISVSLGLTKFKGPAKNSPISLETAGLLLSKKVKFYLRIKKINLVLHTRLNRKVKEFLKGFSKYGGVKIRRILFFNKLAHNGCRLKNPKRR